jgi:WD40 repeat protein
MASSPPVYCPLCGAVNQPDAASCVACGHPLVPTPTQQLLAPAALLRGRYRILGQAGRGGFSTVYRAEDTQVHSRVVAVKEISQRRQTPEDAQKTSAAFQQEAVLLAGLSHPNLPRIHDYFEEGGRWYLVMDFLQGETLEERLRRSPGGRLSVPEALEVALQLAAVLDYLHTRQPPVIFRDLKPANVMLTAPLHASLIDFGIARLFKPGQSKDTLVIGTIGYLAPEGYGKGQTTPRSDIYSLGVTLHQMLSGVDPAEKPFHVAPLGVPVPPALAALVAEMVEIEETRRPASMALVRQRLQAMLDTRAAATEMLPRGIAGLSSTHSPEHSIHPYPSTPLNPPIQPPTAPRPGGFSRRAVAIGLGLGALVVGAGVVGILRARSQPVAEVPVPTPVPSNTAATFQNVITPTATPNTQGTVAYPPYRGQFGRIFAVAWSPLDGKTIASASIDGTVQVWDSVTQKNIATYRAFTLSMAWSPNGKYLASGLSDNSVHVWNPQNGKLLYTYSRPRGGLARLASLIASSNGRKAPLSGGGVEALTWGPNSSEIASSGDDGRIQAWTLVTQQTNLDIGGATNGVFALAWSPDNGRIASGSGAPNNTIYFWEVRTGDQLAAYPGHTDSVTALQWSPDGHYFASASLDGTVRVWVPYGGPAYVYTGHSASVFGVAWSPDGKRIASASQDGTVQLWDALTGANVFIYRGHTGSVNAVAWSKDGRHLASGGDDMSVQVWEAR